MKNNIYLRNLSPDLKKIISAFLILIALGISTGIVYISYTTQMSLSGTIEQYKGSSVSEYDIPEKFPKEFESMIRITHEHVIAFSIISILVSFIFNFNSIIKRKIKLFLMLEPYISIVLTFTSMWLMRYCCNSFAYLLIFSSALMYLCWYLMIFVSLYDLNK